MQTGEMAWDVAMGCCLGEEVIVTSVLPKRNRLRETRKQAQPTGCPLSHRSPRKLGTSYGVLQLIFKLREISSQDNWYIYNMRKSRDRWLCTQSRPRKGLCAKVWDVRARWLCMVHDNSFDLYISHFYYIQNESDSFGNESPRNSRFTRFRRFYICPDPCIVAGDTALRSLPLFCLPVSIPHPNMAVLAQFFELREVPHITG